jgi:GNAT superfamily N-acetyltransferase
MTSAERKQAAMAIVHGVEGVPRDSCGAGAYRKGVETRTLTWRALTTEDVPALTRAYAAVEAVDHTGEHYSEQDLRDGLEDESIDLRRDSLAALDPDGELVAFAWVHGSVEVHDLDRIDAEGAVVPAARRRGLGRRLLEGAEERAARLHTQRHPDVPGAVCVDVHENNPGKRALVRAAGYEATRWWYRMVRKNLDDPLPDVPPTPPGLTWRRTRQDGTRRSGRRTGRRSPATGAPPRRTRSGGGGTPGPRRSGRT